MEHEKVFFDWFTRSCVVTQTGFTVSQTLFVSNVHLY